MILAFAIACISCSEKDFVVTSVQEFAIGQSAENLSVLGTSNCYIVSSKGFYKFPAVKGNSSDMLAGVSSVELVYMGY